LHWSDLRAYWFQVRVYCHFEPLLTSVGRTLVTILKVNA